MTKENLKKLLEEINKKYKEKENKDFKDIQEALFIIDKVSDADIFSDKVINDYSNIVISSLEDDSLNIYRVDYVYSKYIYQIIANITKDHIKCYLKSISIDDNISEIICNLYNKDFKEDNKDKLDFIDNLFKSKNIEDIKVNLNNKKINYFLTRKKDKNNKPIIDGETTSVIVSKIQSILTIISIVGVCIWIWILTQTFENLPDYVQYLLDIIPPLVSALVGIIVPFIIGIINKHRIKNNSNLQGLDYDDLMEIKYGHEIPKLGTYMPIYFIKYKSITKNIDKSKTKSKFNDVSQGPNSQLAGRDINN